MPRHNDQLISILTLKRVVFDRYTKSTSMPTHHTEMKSFSTTHTTKSISCLCSNQVKFDPPHWDQADFGHRHNNQVNFHDHTKEKKISTRAQKQGQFWSRTKTALISVLTLKPSQFLLFIQNQVNFDPNTEVESMSIPTLKRSQFLMPPDPRTNLILIQTINQVIFDPPTKPSQFWYLHWNQVNSDPPPRNHVFFDHPHVTVYRLPIRLPAKSALTWPVV